MQLVLSRVLFNMAKEAYFFEMHPYRYAWTHYLLIDHVTALLTDKPIGVENCFNQVTARYIVSWIVIAFIENVTLRRSQTNRLASVPPEAPLLCIDNRLSGGGRHIPPQTTVRLSTLIGTQFL